MNKYAYFSLYALSIGVQAIFAITTHRIVLLGPGSVSKWGITSWSERETYFVIDVLALSVLMIPMMSLASIPVIGLYVAPALTCWIFGRLSLVFPSIALDKGVSFKQSWELTKNHQLLMFLVVVIFPLMLAIPAVILDSMPYTFLLASLGVCRI